VINMFKCTIRDLLWLLVLAAVLSAWYGHYKAMVTRQRTMEQSITDEEQEYYRLDAKWNEFARQLPQTMREIGDERHAAYDMNLVAQYELIAVRKRLSALGVELPKQSDGREGGISMTREEEKDLEIAKQEYKRKWVAKFGARDDWPPCLSD
jgi:hypothetical protein